MDASTITIGSPADTSSAPVGPAPESEFELTKEIAALADLFTARADEDTKYTNRLEVADHEVITTAEKQAHSMADDVSVIPIRRIKALVRQQVPSLTQYLSTGRRLILFRDASDTSFETEPFEIWYAGLMRHSGWKKPWLDLIEATQLHGGDFMEYGFDESTPSKTYFEHVMRKDVLLPQKCKNIQDQERIGRIYMWPVYKIKNTAGFDEKVVEQICSTKKSSDEIEIIKVWVKHPQTKAIWVYWLGKDMQNSGFLIPPEKLDLGLIQFGEDGFTPVPAPMPEPQPGFEQAVAQVNPQGFPQFLPADVFEFPLIFNSIEFGGPKELYAHRGLAYHGLPAQEAETRLWTAAITQADRCSRVFASTTNQDSNPEQTFELKPDTIHGSKVDFWSPPAPDAAVIGAARSLAQEILQQSGQVDNATLNRGDSRKTKREMDMAANTAQAIDTNHIEPFALSIVWLFSHAYDITRSQVWAGTIKVAEYIQAFLGHNYSVLPAGDVDFVERQQRTQVLTTIYPQMQNSPLGDVLLRMLITAVLPDDSNKLLTEYDKAKDQQAQLKAFATVIAALPLEKFDPTQQQQLAPLQNAARNIIGAGSPPAQGPTDSPAVAPAPGNA